MAVLVAGCESTYYSAMEKLGVEKRDILVDRVEAARDSQEAAKAQFVDQYTSNTQRRTAERQLRATRRSYASMIASMWRAEGKIAPVLNAFRDQVLFLKHNLNARAIASLRAELSGIEADTAILIREMEAAITESNAFIEKLTG